MIGESWYWCLRRVTARRGGGPFVLLGLSISEEPYNMCAICKEVDVEDAYGASAAYDSSLASDNTGIRIVIRRQRRLMLRRDASGASPYALRVLIGLRGLRFLKHGVSENVDRDRPALTSSRVGFDCRRTSSTRSAVSQALSAGM